MDELGVTNATRAQNVLYRWSEMNTGYAGEKVAGGAEKIRISSISKTFASGLLALKDVDLSIYEGEFISIVGPSGCGKSTLLRIVAGLTTSTSGQCKISGGGVPEFVFQEPALLPWRSAIRNAELIMELEGIPKDERRKKALAALELVGLKGFEAAYPHSLSGGMKMRLSLARAIAMRPQVFLMDEPLAAVDELTREKLQEDLLDLWAGQHFTAIFITHNVQEAVYLSSRVVVMSPRPGQILDVIEIPFAYPRPPELRSTGEFAAICGNVSLTLRGYRAAENRR